MKFKNRCCSNCGCQNFDTKQYCIECKGCGDKIEILDRSLGGKVILSEPLKKVD